MRLCYLAGFLPALLAEVPQLISEGRLADRTRSDGSTAIFTPS